MVEMMRNNLKIWMSLLIACCIVLFLMPAGSCCEEMEPFDIDLSENTEEQSGEEHTSASGLFDYILERYPLLNEIIEMILDLLYNWLTQLYTG
jgi:hypothetical protein